MRPFTDANSTECLPLLNSLMDRFLARPDNQQSKDDLNRMVDCVIKRNQQAAAERADMRYTTKKFFPENVIARLVEIVLTTDQAHKLTEVVSNAQHRLPLACFEYIGKLMEEAEMKLSVFEHA